jgi:hypothetical protein
MEIIDGKIPERLEGADGEALTFIIKEAMKPKDDDSE